MSRDDLKKCIAKLIESKGADPVQLELIRAGLGLSTVQKILKGDYDPGPKAQKAMESVIVKMAS